MFQLTIVRLKRIANVMTSAITTILAKVPTTLLSGAFDMLNRLEMRLIGKKIMVTYRKQGLDTRYYSIQLAQYDKKAARSSHHG